MTKIFAKLSLAVFLAALLAPCGIVPRHDMSGGVSSAGAICAGHESSAAHDHGDGIANAGGLCGVDLAAPRGGPEPAALAGPTAPAFDAVAVKGSIGVVPPLRHAQSRAGPPAVPIQVYFPAPRLLL